MPLKNFSTFNKLIFIASFCVFLFSSAALIGRAIDTYKAKSLNNQLSKLYEEINTPQENSIDIEPNIIEDAMVNLVIDSIPSSELDIDEADKTVALKIANKAALERRRLEEQKKVEQIKKQVPKLLKINSDIKGWIRIYNTEVSNPIVQTADNSFYLNHDVTKKESRHGSIFMDFENDVSSPSKLKGQNIILYGHNMKDKTMFGSLRYFREDNFFIINDIINLDIFPNSYKFKIFGVYLFHADFDYRNTKLGSKEDIAKFLKSIRSKSIQSREVTLEPSDTLLTLSTCGYDFDDARIVVLGKLLKDTDKK